MRIELADQNSITYDVIVSFEEEDAISAAFSTEPSDEFGTVLEVTAGLGGVEEIDSLIGQLFEIRKAFLTREIEMGHRRPSEEEPDA